MKIKSVIFNGDRHNLTHWEKSAIRTVDHKLISKHKYAKRMHILQEAVTCTAEFKNGVMVIVELFAGYCFNHADVPQSLNWLVRYDDPALSDGALFHDPLFNLKRLGQDVSATILSDVAEFQGLSHLKARLVHIAVSGRIAKRLYEDRDDFDYANSVFCSVSVGRWK